MVLICLLWMVGGGCRCAWGVCLIMLELRMVNLIRNAEGVFLYFVSVHVQTEIQLLKFYQIPKT